MDRKISKFAIGEEVTTHEKIRLWATGNHQELSVVKVFSITENSQGIYYRMTTSQDYREDVVVSPSEAKKMALKLLAERMIIISESEEIKCQQL